MIENFGTSRYAKGEPRYFNHGSGATPVALFYDGSVRELPMKRAAEDDARVRDQANKAGLWLRTPGNATRGYYEHHSIDDFRGSPHIFTNHGIRGRDLVTRR